MASYHYDINQAVFSRKMMYLSVLNYINEQVNFKPLKVGNIINVDVDMSKY